MTILLGLIFFLSAALPLRADGLDSLLTVQRARAGTFAPSLFYPLDRPNPLTRDSSENSDLRFLLAYASLGDLATDQPQALLENVKLARRARSLFPWSGQVTDELYRHFVLPHRVSQEPFVPGWRERFLNELRPRVERLTMTEAALEVNHWCHEYVTYKASDSRDQDPLTTLRAGLGRCEEEMIFTICALRSVGIPARQCYTPFWPHMDDNHAWVEVWADGRWHYYGACEPEPVLDRGWFTDAAARAMLVVSTAYGDYNGSEPFLRRYGSSTAINSTAVYGASRNLRVTLLDPRGNPVPRHKLIFNLFNYGSLLPAMALETDSAGQVNLVCGPGDWFITAGKDSLAALVHASASNSSIQVMLGDTQAPHSLTQADYHPPAAPPPAPAIERDSFFSRRLAYEDSLRESRLWHTWAAEQGMDIRTAPPTAPDTAAIHRMAWELNLDTTALVEIFRGARGNWGTLYRFLTGRYPDSTAVYDAAGIQARFTLLQTLTDKDRRDFSVAALEDHYRVCTQSKALPELLSTLSELDSSSRARITECVIAPRINYEPSAPWRLRTIEPIVVSSHSEFATSTDDSVLLSWLKYAISVDSTRDRLGPPLTPAQVLSLRRGTAADIERLYVALCRVRGIPARFSPVTSRLERWSGEEWQEIPISPRPPSAPAPATGKLCVEAAPQDSSIYMKEWSVQNWADDHLGEVDLGFGEPHASLTWPQDLPVGLYCLTTGKRQAGGSANLAFNWFEIKPDSTTSVSLRFR